ncbi:hypothetical protein V8E36_008082 [Tilletia maclaganii]
MSVSISMAISTSTPTLTLPLRLILILYHNLLGLIHCRVNTILIHKTTRSTIHPSTYPRRRTHPHRQLFAYSILPPARPQRGPFHSHGHGRGRVGPSSRGRVLGHPLLESRCARILTSVLELLCLLFSQFVKHFHHHLASSPQCHLCSLMRLRDHHAQHPR